MRPTPLPAPTFARGRSPWLTISGASPSSCARSSARASTTSRSRGRSPSRRRGRSAPRRAPRGVAPAASRERLRRRSRRSRRIPRPKDPVAIEDVGGPERFAITLALLDPIRIWRMSPRRSRRRAGPQRADPAPRRRRDPTAERDSSAACPSRAWRLDVTPGHMPDGWAGPLPGGVGGWRR